MLSITVSNPDQQVFNHLQKVVIASFESKPSLDQPTYSTYRWEIPKRDTDSWSVLHQRAHELADSYPMHANLPPRSDRPKIVDFSLTQNSLEQVFLHLSRLHESTPAKGD